MNDRAPLLNQPAVVAEVEAAFERYEAALLIHDVATLNAFFLDSPSTVRIGVSEHAYGIDAIRAYRRRAAPLPAGRQLRNTVIATIGTDAASVSTEFEFPDSAFIGRQSQTWVRTAEGWKILAAHVSNVLVEQLRRD